MPLVLGKAVTSQCSYLVHRSQRDLQELLPEAYLRYRGPYSIWSHLGIVIILGVPMWGLLLGPRDLFESTPIGVKAFMVDVDFQTHDGLDV